MAVESELMLHCRTLSDVSCYKDFHIQDWALLLLSYCKIVTQSRYVRYAGDALNRITTIILLTNLLFEVGLFKVVMAVGIVFSANINNLV